MGKIHKTAVPKSQVPGTMQGTFKSNTVVQNQSPAISNVSTPSSVFDTPRRADLKIRVRRLNFENQKLKLMNKSLNQKHNRLKKNLVSESNGARIGKK